METIKEMMVESLHVRIFHTRADMGNCAGNDAAAAIRDVIAQKGTANVMFAAAPSQNEVLSALCERMDIDWTKVNAFHMDEYIGLDPQHPAGFRNFLRKAIFNAFPFRSVNLLNGNAAEPRAEADRYGKLLRENPIDICLCGIGENGHIAFNDPMTANFADSKLVKVVELETACREQQVHDGCFSDIAQVPTYALTVTIPAMISAKAIFCSVPAATKAAAVRNMLQNEVSEKCPASILRKHSNAELYLDKDAAKYIL